MSGWVSHVCGGGLSVDNGPRSGLEKFLEAASDDPPTVLHYEFMQDYRVHLKHLNGRTEEVRGASMSAWA